MILDIFTAFLGAALFLVVDAIVIAGFYKLGHGAGVVFEKERRQRLEIEAEHRIAQMVANTRDEWQTEIDV